MLVIKNLPANAGDIRDAGSIPALGKFPGGGHGSPLQGCLKNPMDRGAWWSSPQGCKESGTTEMTAHMHRFRWASLVDQTVKSLPAMRETQAQSLGCEDHLEKEMATHSSILA